MHFQPSLMFAGEAGNYPSEAPRLDWKGMPWTNTLVYYENPCASVIKLAFHVYPK
jgi:hypothetical protein